MLSACTSGLHTTRGICVLHHKCCSWACFHNKHDNWIVCMLNALQVHLVDSFAGLPTATQARDIDSWSKMEYVSVSLEEVQSNFKAYELDDEQQVGITIMHYCIAYLGMNALTKQYALCYAMHVILRWNLHTCSSKLVMSYTHVRVLYGVLWYDWWNSLAWLHPLQTSVSRLSTHWWWHLHAILHQVTFTKGFFRYSLPALLQKLPNLRTAVLRLVSRGNNSELDVACGERMFGPANENLIVWEFTQYVVVHFRILLSYASTEARQMPPFCIQLCTYLLRYVSELVAHCECKMCVCRTVRLALFGGH